MSHPLCKPGNVGLSRLRIPCRSGMARTMKLKDWLIAEGLTVTEFARRMGKPQPTVARYASGDRVPEKKAMAVIVKLTKKKVQPNDFYEMAK